MRTYKITTSPYADTVCDRIASRAIARARKSRDKQVKLPHGAVLATVEDFATQRESLQNATTAQLQARLGVAINWEE